MKRNRSDVLESNKVPRPKLVPISSISNEFRHIFPYKSLNAMQSQVFDKAYNSDVNLTISSPTGSGKTVIFELAMCRLFETNSQSKQKAKVIYMAPIKALCQERLQDWKNKFGKINLNCVELTGDTLVESSTLGELMSADIILTTPEKIDSTTRKWKDFSIGSLVSQIGLILIDEVHLLNEERGACLEAVVSRLKMIQTSNEMQNKPIASIRLVGLSATIPNFADVAQWLNADSFEFGQEYRPCRLEVSVLGYQSPSNSSYQFERNLDYKLISIIQEHNSNKPTLIFCSTRKSCTQSATFLSTESVKNKKLFVTSVQQQKTLHAASSRIIDKCLRNCILNGVGYHTAGLCVQDRRIVEELFLSSSLLVICTTSTLAQGVNFPAHLVVIKGTQQYKTGLGYSEYSELSILQMIGRAGRPQFDDFGVAIIMTTLEMQQMYENVALGKQIVESHFHSKLICHLNAEITLQTFSTLQGALKWLKSTFLYIRIKKNPTHYLNLNGDITEPILEQMLKELCQYNLDMLKDSQMIFLQPNSSFASTLSGKLMARYYLEFETMQVITCGLASTSNLQDCLDILCRAKEFEEFSLRMGEKKILNECKDLRFPYNGKTKTTEQKISCLLQSHLNGHTFDEVGLNQQLVRILSITPRILRCMIEYMSENRFWSAKYALILLKCIEQGLWENSVHVCKQLDKIGFGLSSILVKNGITSFSKLAETNPRLIETILNRNPPFGTQLLQSVKAIPTLQLETQKNGTMLDISCTLSTSGDAIYYLLVGTGSYELLHKIKLNTSNMKKKCSVSIDLAQGHTHIWIDLIHESLIGLDQHVVIEGICSKVPVREKTKSSIDQVRCDVQGRVLVSEKGTPIAKKIAFDSPSHIQESLSTTVPHVTPQTELEDEFDLVCASLFDDESQSIQTKPEPLHEVISLLKLHFPEIKESLLDELTELQ